MLRRSQFHHFRFSFDCGEQIMELEMEFTEERVNKHDWGTYSEEIVRFSPRCRSNRGALLRSGSQASNLLHEINADITL